MIGTGEMHLDIDYVLIVWAMVLRANTVRRPGSGFVGTLIACGGDVKLSQLAVAIEAGTVKAHC
jgi:hypothetical protein